MIHALAFLTSSLVVIMAPGPDLALITRLVLTGSPRTAVPAAFGMITAGALQAALGALGLSALLAARPDLFAAFRWAGAAVLLVWGCRALRAALRAPDTTESGARAEPDDTPRGRRRAFALGLLCTGSNPKVGIFLMAFLPQFVPAGLHPATGVAVLACCYLALVLAWLLAWTKLVHRLSRHLHSARAQRLTNGLTAVVFGVFALRLALGG
ncbi:LysE family translocator [Streptomyces sp. NPDC038707]|uniref:LysE family translocator n=1 Tax=Streptomyces achromogenes subsp. streptozoticus TaxID=285532 RepID=A0A411MR88_STRC2|nr:LysE family translocator [Streptomyces achromogenes subsp. streptozoticus]QBA82208.1 LysE family translocator [Streptomyces achromogenes subsp. streptozoticus]QBF29336.1 putative membrane protein [Streptomyces achromogenes subsp. streptozoticus]